MTQHLIQATGNYMESHDGYFTFLEVSGGSGNTDRAEVHLLMRGNDGEFSQGWFERDQILRALSRISEEYPRCTIE